MIHYVIKLLVCLSKPKSGVKIKSKKVNPTKILDTSKKIDENVVQCTEQIRSWCHIEYSLLENVLPKVELNVVTWGPAVKIYTKNDCRSIKTHIVGDLIWINFAMVHNISDLDDGDIELLKNSVVTFKFSQDQDKMMEHVLNDWPKAFKICTKPGETKSKCNNLFPELHQTDPIDKDYKEVLRERIERFNIARPQKNSIVSMIQISPCEKKIESKINEMLPFLQNKSQFEPSQRKKVNKSKSKEKKIKTVIDGTKENAKLIIKSELVIAGKSDIFTEQRDIFPTLRYAAVYVTSSKILTDEQDFTFIPLTITIDSIEDLPLKHLQTFKIRNIYARYELPNICKNIETAKHPMNKDIILDDTKVFFISYLDEKNRFPHLMLRPSVLSLTEMLTTQYFVLKLYGELETYSDVAMGPCLFGNKPDDEFIGTPSHIMFHNYKPPPVQSSEIFLGSACFNLIKLAKGCNSIEMSAVLTPAPISLWDPAFKLDDLLDTVDNQSDREAILNKFTTPGCIPQHVLIKHSTRVTITVSIGTLLSNLTENQLLEISSVYNRVIIVFKNRTDAINVFQHIVEVNAKFGTIHRDTINSVTSIRSNTSIANFISPSKLEYELSTVRSFPSSKLSRTRTQSSLAGHLKEIQKNLLTSNKALTGFFIENKDECMIVVETIPYVTSHVIEFIHLLVQNDAHIVHDSSIYFTKRKYKDFPIVKMYTVKLPSSINVLIQKSSRYIEDKAYEAALQTLFLLDLLRRSQTLNSAFVNQLFPSCDQLVMFNHAFGETAADFHHESE